MPNLEQKCLANLLATLEEQAGNETTATGLRHEAYTTLEDIIEHIPEGELRALFVALLRLKRMLLPW